MAKRPSLLERVRKWSAPPSRVGGRWRLSTTAVRGGTAHQQLRVTSAAEKARTAKALKNEQRRAAEAEKLFQQVRRGRRCSRASLRGRVGQCACRICKAPANACSNSLSSITKAFSNSSRATPPSRPNWRKDAIASNAFSTNYLLFKASYQQMLAVNPSVQQDLRLSDHQRRAHRPIVEARLRGRDRGTTRKGLPKQIGNNSSPIARENDKALSEILEARQRERLRQIALQSQGLMAFHEPRQSLMRLHLTAGTKANNLCAIEGSLFGRMRPPGPPRPGKPPGPFKQMADVLTTRNAPQPCPGAVHSRTGQAVA